jgi:hypothetical protein
VSKPYEASGLHDHSLLIHLSSNLRLQDAWLEAESAAAAKQVEAILYSESGWGPGQTLLLEDGRPAWHADLWPPKAAEEVGLEARAFCRDTLVPLWCVAGHAALLHSAVDQRHPCNLVSVFRGAARSNSSP